MKSLVKDLELARARVAELEQKAERERRESLATLPVKYGYSSFEEFADAVREANGVSPKRDAEISTEVIASEAATPYWREAPEVETAPTTFVAQGIQASRQAARPHNEEATSAPETVSPVAPESPAPVNQAAEAAPAPAAPAAKPLPTGTSLADPSQFGLMPDNSLFERGEKSEEAFRMHLNAANIFAQQVLHTSRVPAPVWREWRDFARRAAEVLRGGVPVA